MQIEKTQTNDHLRVPKVVPKVSWKFCTPSTYSFAVICPWNLLVSLKSSQFFNDFYCLFLFINKTLQLNKLKTRTAMNAKNVFLLFVSKQSYIFYHLICMTAPLTFKKIELMEKWEFRFVFHNKFLLMIL